MKTTGKTEVRNSVGRLIFAGVAVLIQIAWLLLLFLRLSRYSVIISVITTILAVILVLKIIENKSNAAMKMLWIVLILSFPVLGAPLYLLLGHSWVTDRMRKRYQDIDKDLAPWLKQQEETLAALEKENPGVANQCRYICNYAGYPVWNNTDVIFYDEAEKGFKAQLADLRQAQRFIFMEYHAIEEAEAFAELKEVLAERARAGVEIRVIYDDVGSVGFINVDFIKRMEKLGISCKVFNPALPVLNLFMNNRDHRKITVVDGKVGYTGGYNLADEYFNIVHPYGRWKDTGVRMEGNAVQNLTATFLEMWYAIGSSKREYECFFPKTDFQAAEGGYVQPYADSPLDHERVGENVYLNVIKNAKRYVYFMTPYLIITDEMSRELELAAKRGVDVRLITPGIPDKKMVYRMTRSYYNRLVEGGVRIYEYTPGFCHAKQCVSDDEVATVGTINLDYRSLYLHFENGTFFTNAVP